MKLKTIKQSSKMFGIQYIDFLFWLKHLTETNWLDNLQMMFRWFDSNQRLNDQGFIDLELPQIFYTSIFQHKSKPHISKRDFKLDAKQNSCFYRKFSSEKSLSRNGGQALALAAGRRPASPFLERIFVERALSKQF